MVYRRTWLCGDKFQRVAAAAAFFQHPPFLRQHERLAIDECEMPAALARLQIEPRCTDQEYVQRPANAVDEFIQIVKSLLPDLVIGKGTRLKLESDSDDLSMFAKKGDPKCPVRLSNGIQVNCDSDACPGEAFGSKQDALAIPQNLETRNAREKGVVRNRNFQPELRQRFANAVDSMAMPESLQRGIFIHANEDDTCAGTEVVSSAEFGGGGVSWAVTAAGPKTHDLE